VLKYGRARHATDYNIMHVLCMLDTLGYRLTLRNKYILASTVRVITQMTLNVIPTMPALYLPTHTYLCHLFTDAF